MAACVLRVLSLLLAATSVAVEGRALRLRRHGDAAATAAVEALGAARSKGDAAAASAAAGRRLRAAGSGAHRAGTRAVYMLPELLDGLRTVASERAHAVEQRYRLERERLTAALQLTADNSSDRSLVESALQQSAEDYSESQVAATEAMEFYYTAKGMLGSRSPAPSCAMLACGEHAKCSDSQGGARCECEPCYAGDGYRCRAVPCTPATVGSALPIRGAMPPGYPVVPRESPGKVAELQLVAFGDDFLALVVRESGNGNRGSLILGKIVDTEVTWGKKQLLDPTLQTFGLALAVSPGGRIAIGFRDRKENGVGYIMGGQANATGHELQAMLSPPEPVARAQTEPMVLVQLEASRVVCLYSETEAAEDGQTKRSFGGALLAEVISGGPVRVLGRYRFVEGVSVTRLAAVALTPTSMIVGYRALLPAGAAAGQPSRELSAVWLGMDGPELLIDPKPIAIEPEHSGMLARSLALVGKDTIAYTFTGKQKVIKTAILHVDPESHVMSFLESPKVVSGGLPTFLRSVSLPGSPYVPSTFTILQRPKEACTARVCRVSPAGRIADCRDVPWAEQELKDVSASRLLDGRIVVAFVDAQSRVLYQLLGAEEHGAMLDFGENAG